MEVPIHKQDRQRLKLLEDQNQEDRLGKVRRASKGSLCVAGAWIGKGASGRKPGSDCSRINDASNNTDRPLDDIKRMILRIEAMLDKLVFKGYLD